MLFFAFFYTIAIDVATFLMNVQHTERWPINTLTETPNGKKFMCVDKDKREEGKKNNRQIQQNTYIFLRLTTTISA